MISQYKVKRSSFVELKKTVIVQHNRRAHRSILSRLGIFHSMSKWEWLFVNVFNADNPLCFRIINT
jgi:hypothetical protein